jgi:hypothetical protein
LHLSFSKANHIVFSKAFTSSKKDFGIEWQQQNNFLCLQYLSTLVVISHQM